MYTYLVVMSMNTAIMSVVSCDNFPPYMSTCTMHSWNPCGGLLLLSANCAKGSRYCRSKDSGSENYTLVMVLGARVLN